MSPNDVGKDHDAKIKEYKEKIKERNAEAERLREKADEKREQAEKHRRNAEFIRKQIEVLKEIDNGQMTPEEGTVVLAEYVENSEISEEEALGILLNQRAERILSN